MTCRKKLIIQKSFLIFIKLNTFYEKEAYLFGHYGIYCSNRL